MKQAIGIILIVVALGLGYMGFNKLNESTATIEIASVKLSASDGEGKTEAYIYLGLAAVSLIAGAVIISKK